MEAKELRQNMGGMELQPGYSFSIPDEQLRDYYLKECVLLQPDFCLPGRTEAEYLTELLEEQKLILKFLRVLVDASVELNLDSLYEVTTAYMMRDDIPRQERIEVNARMSKLFAVFSLLQQKIDLTAELHNLYGRKCTDLQQLLTKETTKGNL